MSALDVAFLDTHPHARNFAPTDSHRWCLSASAPWHVTLLAMLDSLGPWSSWVIPSPPASAVRLLAKKANVRSGIDGHVRLPVPTRRLHLGTEGGVVDESGSTTEEAVV